MTTPDSDFCPPDFLADLVSALGDPDNAASSMQAALARHPNDPRLHFLKGSVLAGERRYDEAKASMDKALTLAPGYAIARFQLGFLHYTSGDAALAKSVWQPLSELDEGDALRLFADGLNLLAGDDQPAAIALLERGIAANAENPPLNADMRMLINELGGASEPEEALSETQLLLQQSGPRTRH